MPSSLDVNNLIFNKLSESKYSSITPVDGQFYVTPDDNIVYTTGNQTIDGTKTFTGVIKKQMSSLGYTAFYVQNTAITKGTTPSSDSGGIFSFQDSSTTAAAGRLGGVQFVYNANGEIITYLQAFKPEANSTANASIRVHYPATGDPYTYAPPSALTNSIVTTIALNKVENGYVKYGNGIIAQWGYIAVSASTIADKTYTINLNTPFTSSYYYVNGTFKYTASTSNWGSGCPGISAKTTTNFTILSDGINTSSPISGVYWFAYGY